jgi:hypothetical protein
LKAKRKEKTMGFESIKSSEIVAEPTVGISSEAPKHTVEGHEKCAYYPSIAFDSFLCPHGMAATGAFYNEDYVRPIEIEREKLATSILRSSWYHRSQSMSNDRPDQSWCDMCDGKGGYSDYTSKWHDQDCPVRWAGNFFGTEDVLEKGNELSEEAK